MQIHELKVKSRKTRKRVGRGGKRGTYSGRGMKGQKSRSGGNVNPLFQGGRASSLIAKLKKVRGFKSVTPKKNVVNLETIEKKFKNGDTISVKSLLEAKIIQRSKAENGVKILGTGEIKKKITTDEDILVSESAKKAIEKAGGKVGYVKRVVAKKMEKMPVKKESPKAELKKTTKKK